MSEEPLRAILRTFTYRPGWKFAIVDGRLMIRAMVIDTNDHSQMTPLCNVQSIPEFVRKDFDWPRWLLHVILEIEDHEAREFFKIDGVKVFDPHG